MAKVVTGVVIMAIWTFCTIQIASQANTKRPNSSLPRNRATSNVVTKLAPLTSIWSAIAQPTRPKRSVKDFTVTLRRPDWTTGLIRRTRNVRLRSICFSAK